MSNLFNHVKVVLKHKREVFKAMSACGHSIQGLFHDMSKFSPIEFIESVKYYQGTRSPIDAAKEDKGYSMAWFHHRGRNPHHSQYWCDISFGSVKPCEIPWKYLLELMCDAIAAGKVYQGESWTDQSPLSYWETKDSKSFYHINTKKKLEFYYKQIAEHGWKQVSNEIWISGDYYETYYNIKEGDY